MFVDELKIYAKAGNGGNGVVRWLHEKGKEWSGPSGGDGGKGGDVYLEAVKDLGILARYVNSKEFYAQKGGDGMNKSQHGKNGEDLTILIPVGSVVTNLVTGRKIEFLEEGKKEIILKGGRGGFGNEHFKGPVNVTPKESTPGRDGEEGDFFIEVLLAVDGGFIGLPNAGKSSLLNSLTRARAKVGAYAFTTLEPNLGDFYGYILADIPGLIEGASLGKGLGHKFLRHIKRTKMVIHLISLENPDIEVAYNIVRGELEKFDPALSEKSEMIILSKSDMVSEETSATAILKMKKTGKEVSTVSIYDDNSIKNLSDKISQSLKRSA